MLVRVIDTMPKRPLGTTDRIYGIPHFYEHCFVLNDVAKLAVYLTHMYIQFMWEIFIFTVGEAVRSTCGKSHEKEKKKEEDRFLLSLLQTI